MKPLPRLYDNKCHRNERYKGAYGKRMTTNLQTLIHSAEQLTAVEQVELINAISSFLYQHYQQELRVTDFWQPHPIASIVAAQQT